MPDVSRRYGGRVKIWARTYETATKSAVSAPDDTTTQRMLRFRRMAKGAMTSCRRPSSVYVPVNMAVRCQKVFGAWMGLAVAGGLLVEEVRSTCSVWLSSACLSMAASFSLI